MKLEFLIFVLFFGAVVGRSVQDDEASCDVPSSSRKECGWLGIDEKTCAKRGCCWNSGDPDAKYCFVKKWNNLPEGQCPVAPSERQECGHYGITKQECLDKTCCWDDSVEGAKWCFKDISNPSSCYISHGVFGTCRYICKPGEEIAYVSPWCEGRICCYTLYPGSG